MPDTGTDDSAMGFYRRRIGVPQNAGEVYGYLLFVAGLLLGLLGILLFVSSESAGSLRQWSVASAAAGLAALVAGSVIRLPLERAATYAVYVGLATCAGAIAWFFVVFPNQWTTTTGHRGVIGLYAFGLVVVGAGGVVVPLVGRADAAEPAAETAVDDEPTESLADHDRDDEIAELRDEADGLRDETAELRGEAETLRARLDALRSSQAQFEVYEDRGGEYRWRLRHRNGNIVATGGEGYTRKHNAQKGLQSVRRNALGAGTLYVEPEADEASEAGAGDEGDDAGETAGEPAVGDVPLLADAAEESHATFDVYEDKGGEYRWRLVHDNGNIIADSGEGYDSRRNAERAVESVQRNVGPAAYLQFDPASFELFEDAGGEWRWRLVHRNGNVLGDSGQGYSRRRDARRAVESVRERATEDAFEVYEDAGGDYRWRLMASNGNVVADSGEGYASEQNARDAVERVQSYAPDADALDVGDAAFEVYEDAGGDWRWRLRHRNGNVIADGGQGYSRRRDAHAGIDSVKRNAPGAGVDAD